MIAVTLGVARAYQSGPPTIIAAVDSPEPPGFLLLGPDALAAYRYVADARAAEIAQWERLTAATDFEA